MRKRRMLKLFWTMIWCLLLLMGCAGSVPKEDYDDLHYENSESDTKLNTQKEKPNQDNNEVQKMQSEESIEEKDKTDWKYICENYPAVDYDDIINGVYKDTYVILHGITDKVDINKFDLVDSWTNADIWFKYGDTYYPEGFSFWCDKIDERYNPLNIKNNEWIEVCVYINKDGSFGGNILGFQVSLNEDITLQDIYERFEESCEEINTKDILRDSEKYRGAYYYANGKVFQVVDETDSFVKLLLEIGEDDYIYVQHSIRENEGRILEGDDISVYGMSYGTFSYTSMLGGKKEVPNISAEFIHNYSVD